MKVYAGTPAAARSYLEADRSRADDYYLTEGSGLARRYTASGGRVQELTPLARDTYEAWVAGRDPDSGEPRGAAAHRRPGGTLRGGRGQRTEVLVTGGRAPPGH